MRWKRLEVLTLLLVGMVLACTGTAPPPATKAPEKSAGGSALEQLVGPARQEGKIAVFGPPGENARKAFAEEFQAAYPGISVAFEGGFSPGHLTKILQAHREGQSIADIILFGPEQALTLKTEGLLQEIEPALVSPEIKDGSKWWQGKIDFIDKEGKYAAAFWAYPSEPFYYNADNVKETDIRSWKDLLDPKYKDRIIIYDPTIGGTGLNKLNHFMQEPRLGEPYVRALLNPSTGITVTRDDRQLVESIARGAHWIGIGGTWTTAGTIAQSFPSLKWFPAERLEEGTVFTSGFGNVGIMKSPVNPNAAKLYLNWVLSREGQTTITGIMGYPSGRTDVSEEKVPEAFRRKPNAKNFVEYTEDAVMQRPKAIQVAKEVLGR